MTSFHALRSSPSGPAFVGVTQGDTLLWDATQRLWYVGPGGGGGGGGLPLADGTKALPSLSFISDLSLGTYYKGAELAGWAVGTDDIFEVGNATITNEDPISPAVVRYSMQGFQLPLAGVDETAFIYAKIDPSAANHHPCALYVDITANQIDTDGPAIKVIHAGEGDGIYVAQFGNGSAYEAATWADGSRGYISTIQIAGLPNSTLFNALWDQPDVPNYGMYYAALATANALTIQKRDATAIAGLTQIRLLSQDGATQYFGVYNDGAALLSTDDATAIDTANESPELRLYGSVWNAGAAKEARIFAKCVPLDPAAGTFALRVYAQLEGAAAVLLGQWTQDGTFDLQAHSVVNCSGIQANPNLPMYAAGVLAFELAASAVADDGQAILTMRQGGAYVQKRVVQGAADSGGAGFRMLRVVN